MSNVIEGAPNGPGNAVVTWQDQLKQYAVAAVETEQPQGQFFSIRSGVLAFGGVPIPNNTMDVIIIGSLHENVFYRNRYNPDKPEGPACYAFSKTGVDMRPDPALVSDQQSTTCKDCPQNKWGSDPKGGRGKACKNVRRLGLISAGVVATPDKIGEAPIGYLRVPVTSVAQYQRFVATVGARGLPPFAVVCRVRALPDPKTQVRVEFEALHSIADQGALQALLARHEIEQRLIDFPYESSPGDDAEAAGKPSHQGVPPVPPPAPSSTF